MFKFPNCCDKSKLNTGGLSNLKLLVQWFFVYDYEKPAAAYRNESWNEQRTIFFKVTISCFFCPELWLINCILFSWNSPFKQFYHHSCYGIQPRDIVVQLYNICMYNCTSLWPPIKTFLLRRILKNTTHTLCLPQSFFLLYIYVPELYYVTTVCHIWRKKSGKTRDFMRKNLTLLTDGRKIRSPSRVLKIRRKINDFFKDFLG